MRIVTNERLIQRNRTIAKYSFFGALALLGVSFLVSNVRATSTLILFAPLIVLPVAFGATLFAVRMANNWLREPTPEKVLQEGLKGAGHKSSLYHYTLPANHVLVAPQGVFTFTIRPQDGQFGVEGSKWKRKGGLLAKFMAFFRQDMLGDPNFAAERDAEKMQHLIESAAADTGIKVQPVIVFTSPRASVEIVNPAIPVIYADGKRKPNLKTLLKDFKKDATVALSDDQIAVVEWAIERSSMKKAGTQTEQAEE